MKKLTATVLGLLKKLKSMSNKQATFIAVYIGTALLALPVVFALGDEDPFGKLIEIAPLVMLSFLTMLVGIVICWIPEWFKK